MIYIHADDFGASKQITDDILETVLDGNVNSISIMPNGVAYDYAVEKIKIMGNEVRIGVHCNLAEGRPISHPSDIDLLVDENGYFYHSFVSLYYLYIKSSPRVRMILVDQIELELNRQVSKVSLSFGNKVMVVDSHIHYHMIPFIFTVLLNLKDKYKIPNIRLVNEVFVFSIKDFLSLKGWGGINLVKYFVLSSLSYFNTKKTQYHKKQLFFGVLYTGNMSVNVIKSFIFVLQRKDYDYAEILLHPGGAAKGEAIWDNQKWLKNFYCSNNRKVEKELLLSDELKGILGE